MKKILAVITAFFMSLSTGTSYTVAPDKNYSSDYYTVTDTEMPNYRDYFGGGIGASSTSGCTTVSFNSNGKSVGFGMGYWFVDGEQPYLETSSSGKDSIKANVYTLQKDGKYKVTKQSTHTTTEINGHKYNDAVVKPGMFKDGTYIIAPFQCTLISRTISGSVTDMKLNCNVGANTYYVRIHNMKCWYCDVNRTGEFTFHTCDEQYGKSFSGGNVLGIATAQTYITISPVGDTGNVIGHCSMHNFYKGTYKREN